VEEMRKKKWKKEVDESYRFRRSLLFPSSRSNVLKLPSRGSCVRCVLGEVVDEGSDSCSLRAFEMEDSQLHDGLVSFFLSISIASRKHEGRRGRNLG
jgi:hypothetical protein